MKTRFFIPLFAIIVLFPLQLVYAPPSSNPDWQSYPYCPGGCSNEYLKTEWAKYYDINGSEWMEQKKIEMLFAIDNGTLEQWVGDDPTWANSNVYLYYFYQGDIPNYEGKFVEQVFLERDLKDLENDLRQNQIPLGNNVYMDLTVFAIFLGGGIAGIVFLVWRKRK